MASGRTCGFSRGNQLVIYNRMGLDFQQVSWLLINPKLNELSQEELWEEDEPSKRYIPSQRRSVQFGRSTNRLEPITNQQEDLPVLLAGNRKEKVIYDTFYIHASHFFFIRFRSSWLNWWLKQFVIHSPSISRPGRHRQLSAPVGFLWSASVNQPFPFLIQLQYCQISIYLVVVIRMKNQTAVWFYAICFASAEGLSFSWYFFFFQSYDCETSRVKDFFRQVLELMFKRLNQGFSLKKGFCQFCKHNFGFTASKIHFAKELALLVMNTSGDGSISCGALR